MKGGNQERLCVACRKLRKKDRMIRFVRIGGTIEPDFSGKLQGRGAYVCKDPACLTAAKEKHFLRRGLGGPGDEEAVRKAMERLFPDTEEVPVE